MLLKHFYVEKIAHSSYMLAGNDICAIIDPSRDIDMYLDEAYKRGLKITHILQTHLHADFVSGHMDLAEITGAKIYMPKSGEANFPVINLVEGDSFEIEDMRIDVLETPGHTPEHLCYIVTDTTISEEPVGIFTGDTLFVGDVGRPDLFPDKKEELASKLYDSLHDKILKLPDHVEVYPAHGAGSLCGKAVGAKYMSTIGYERRFNPVLQIESREEFIKSLTLEMPEVPDHFALCSDFNRQGPVILEELPPLEAFTAEQFYEKWQDEGAVVVDVRSYVAFGSMHIPDAFCIDYDGNLPTFAGWVVPFDKDILLVCDYDEQAYETALWLHRVGLDRTVGFLKGGMKNWFTKAYPTEMVTQVDIYEALELEEQEGFIFIDTRDKAAYQDGHIEGSVNIPAPDLRDRYDELDVDKDYILVCNSGNRSNLGASLLKMLGYHNIFNLAGGMKSYLELQKGEE
jgi:glyoxylase-like metal-dependent hydrolase (beta-lactamase superfamily II)/rhodanese-related sulfurtransferase